MRAAAPFLFAQSKGGITKAERCHTINHLAAEADKHLMPAERFITSLGGEASCVRAYDTVKNQWTWVQHEYNPVAQVWTTELYSETSGSGQTKSGVPGTKNLELYFDNQRYPNNPGRYSLWQVVSRHQGLSRY